MSKKSNDIVLARRLIAYNVCIKHLLLNYFPREILFGSTTSGNNFFTKYIVMEENFFKLKLSSAMPCYMTIRIVLFLYIQ